MNFGLISCYAWAPIQNLNFSALFSLMVNYILNILLQFHPTHAGSSKSKLLLFSNLMLFLESLFQNNIVLVLFSNLVP
jgi:hypothetical protein